MGDQTLRSNQPGLREGARQSFTTTKPTSADYLKAQDGLPARPSGEWARDKLYYVGYYSGIFTTAMRLRWSDLQFIDLMAGPGLCKLKDTGEEFNGSPLIALSLKYPFNRVTLVEQDPILAAALKSRTSAPTYRPAPHIHACDCNDPSVIASIRNGFSSHTLALAFVDLLGLNVTFETIATLTAGRHVDLIVTMPEMDFARNAVTALRRGDDDTQARWTSFFGTERWKSVVERWTRKEVGGAVKLGLLRLYESQLKTLGYYTVIGREPMRGRTGAPLYRLLFASKHPLGISFWQKTTKRNASQQASLF